MPTILFSIFVIAFLGLLLGLFLGFTAKRFEVPEDEKVNQIIACLPGANCGGCGYAGCADFANAIVHEGAAPNRCTSMTQAMKKDIENIIGAVAPEQEKKRAVVFCQGSLEHCGQITEYNGIMDCASAMLVANGGGKSCRFSCIGLGSCSAACPFHAIEIRNGVAFVHAELCTGCGKCVNTCPRNIIRLVPVSEEIQILCSSQDKPVNRRKSCDAACLNCKKCLRKAPEGSMEEQNGKLIITNGKALPENYMEEVKCPTGALARLQISGQNYQDEGKKS